MTTKLKLSHVFYEIISVSWSFLPLLLLFEGGVIVSCNGWERALTHAERANYTAKKSDAREAHPIQFKSVVQPPRYLRPWNAGLSGGHKIDGH